MFLCLSELVSGHHVGAGLFYFGFLDDPAPVDGGVVVAFRYDQGASDHLHHDYGVGVVIQADDVADLDLVEVLVHLRFLVAEGDVAHFEGEAAAAVAGSEDAALELVGVCVAPGHSFGHLLSLGFDFLVNLDFRCGHSHGVVVDLEGGGRCLGGGGFLCGLLGGREGGTCVDQDGNSEYGEDGSQDVLLFHFVSSL